MKKATSKEQRGTTDASSLVTVDTDTTKRVSSIDSVPMKVNSTKELEYYAYALKQKETAVADIDATTNTKAISVEWKHNGKLLAFIPVTITSKTTVEARDDNTLSIKTTLPWWNFFVADVTGVVTNADASLNESAEIKNNMKADTTAEAKAHVIHAIVSSLSLEVHGSVEVGNE
jgi:hypothetical protein